MNLNYFFPPAPAPFVPDCAGLRPEAIASPRTRCSCIGGTDVVLSFLYQKGRRGKRVPRERQNGDTLRKPAALCKGAQCRSREAAEMPRRGYAPGNGPAFTTLRASHASPLQQVAVFQKKRPGALTQPKRLPPGTAWKNSEPTHSTFGSAHRLFLVSNIIFWYLSFYGMNTFISLHSCPSLFRNLRLIRRLRLYGAAGTLTFVDGKGMTYDTSKEGFGRPLL